MSRENGKGGCVAAATPEAARAGADILGAGGNAVDAAVAVSLVLGVSEPAGSGIGGQASFIVHPAAGAPFVLNGTSYAPLHTPHDATLVDLAGHRASTVPSLLRVLELAWRRYGSGRLGWDRLVEPAVRCAGEGYRLGGFRRRALVRYAQCLRRAGGEVAGLLLGPRGEVPKQGARLRQPELAATLARIAEHGADDFYNGEIARGIVADMSASGGWITARDLARLPEPPVVEPVRGTYRGFDLFTLPPPASGWVAVLALNILEQAPAGQLAAVGPDRMVWLAEALGIAHRHRTFRPVPSVSDYEEAVAAKTSKDRARRVVRSLARLGGGETTHFSVADGQGTLVGVTQSLNSYFGAKVACHGLGFLYNDYMREFVAGVEHHPYALRPWAAPHSSMCATVLARDRAPCLVLGSPGDDRIISAVVQVASHWVDVGAGIREAVAASRLHVIRHEEVLLETRPEDPASLLALEELGYTLHLPLSSLFEGAHNPYFGGVHAVAREQGRWRGAADPRRDGKVATPPARTRGATGASGGGKQVRAPRKEGS